MRPQKAAVEKGDPSYAPAILQEVDEAYIAQAEEWEKQCEEKEVVKSDDDEEWQPSTRS